MKVIGHTPSGDYIVTMTREEYDDTIAPNRFLSGGQLRHLRQSKNLTLNDVSQATGISVSFLSDIERGRTNPSLNTYTRLMIFYETAEFA
jgi:DNA-binding transcriptional regulator YiaG